MDIQTRGPFGWSTVTATCSRSAFCRSALSGRPVTSTRPGSSSSSSTSMIFKLCGPADNLAAGWAILRKGLNIEPEQRVGPEGVTFLGCKLERTKARLKSGQMATVWTYNMQNFLHSCVQRHLEFAPAGTSLKTVATPFINESILESTAGGPM